MNSISPGIGVRRRAFQSALEVPISRVATDYA
jgi:hypothetical protein